MRGFRVGNFELFRLAGGLFELDGGAIFGVVPKVLWQKKYPPCSENYVPLVACPILIKTPDSLVMIETGIGNKLTEKQKKIFRVRKDWRVIEDMENLSIKREDIDLVILTHYDFDHAGGVVMQNDGLLTLTFPHARHIIQEQEWHDVLSPNIRSIHTYWPDNITVLKESGNVRLVHGEEEIVTGIKVIHTGGHTRGHQIVQIESAGEVALHLGDLLPTHAHYNPLWVMAFDNFPLDAIRMKEEWEQRGIKQDAWFTFYHDPFMQACRFDEKGTIKEKIAFTPSGMDI
jgi:glyoxylase-like metal-dependent hydrolase (beta-lactamase superfamily II)